MPRQRARSINQETLRHAEQTKIDERVARSVHRDALVRIAVAVQERACLGRVVLGRRCPTVARPCCSNCASEAASSAHGMHQLAKKFSTTGLVLAAASRSALEKPLFGASAGKLNDGTGLPSMGLPMSCGSKVPPLHAVQHRPERSTAGHCHAERCEHEQSPARDAGAGRVLAIHAGTAPRMREGAPTRSRRSASDSPPPNAMMTPPSQIHGASVFTCRRNTAEPSRSSPSTA